MSFRELMTSDDRFGYSFELIPARGSRSSDIENIMKFAEETASTGLIDALSLTDNPGGGPACSPDTLGSEIKGMGVDTIVHFAAKDRNRNGLEARALALNRLGMRNLLVLTGDFPIDVHFGLAKPVFDQGATQLLDYLNGMNKGLKIRGQDDKFALTDPTDFYLGCVVSPFKKTEPETMMQYYKLEKKINAGAEYAICQLGFDYRKNAELITYMKERNLTIPVLGSVFVLRRGVGRVMNRGEVPGCVVSDELVEILNEEFKSPDKGKGAALERASQQIAIMKGLGYKGAHIEGFKLKFNDVRIIIERAKEIGDNWRDHTEKQKLSPKGTYLHYERENNEPNPKTFFRLRRSNAIFQVMRIVHHLFFRQKKALHGPMRIFSTWIDKHAAFLSCFFFFERISKVFLFDCKDCGDCALPDMFYLCPESQCPKYQRVGPCGGSRDGICEVKDDRFCVWFHIYQRAKATGQLERLRDHFIPPRNWNLHGTSSWVNYYLRRDHSQE